MDFLFLFFFFFFNDTATTEIYTLSLHDALPIFTAAGIDHRCAEPAGASVRYRAQNALGFRRSGHELSALRQQIHPGRSEEHTSELQSQSNLVCRLLLEKKKKKTKNKKKILQ